MSYTPFKMKGPSLYRDNSATKNVGDKPRDINKNGQIEGWEQARFDAIKANSPNNYGTMKSPNKKYVSDAQRKAVHASKADGGKGAPKYKSPNKVLLDEVTVTSDKKKETGRKKISTSKKNRDQGFQGYEITYSDGTKSKRLIKG